MTTCKNDKKIASFYSRKSAKNWNRIKQLKKIGTGKSPHLNLPLNKKDSISTNRKVRMFLVVVSKLLLVLL